MRIGGGHSEQLLLSQRYEAPNRAKKNAALWFPGAVVGGIGAAAMTGPSLFPKNSKLQAAGIGIAALAGFGTGVGVEAGVRQLDRFMPGDRLSTQLGTGATAALAAGGISLATKGRSKGGFALAQSVGTVTALAAGAGATGTLVARNSDRLPGGDTAGQLGTAVIAGGAMLGVSALALRGNRGASHLLPDLPELAVDAARTGQLALDRGVGVRGPLTSGGKSSFASWEQMPAQGKRFLSELPSAREIDTVMKTEGAREPIRAYIGLDHTPTGLGEAAGVKYRAELAVKELDRLGAFGRFEVDANGVSRMVEQPRRSIMIAAPTSTGFVNPVAASTHEMLFAGDTATVTVQVARQKSAAELHRVARATNTHQEVIQRVSERIKEIPDGFERPELRLYGESFGAWASENGFAGKDANVLPALARRFGKWDGPLSYEPSGLTRMDELGVKEAMYVGTPKFASFRADTLADNSLTSGDSPLVRNVRNLPDAKQALTEQGAKNTRITFLQHDADPVGLFSPRLLFERPDFLAKNAPRGENVPRTQRFYPGVTGLQTALDQQMAQYFKAGTLEAKGHDYRSEVSYVMRGAFKRHDVSDEQVARIREYNRQVELIKVKHDQAAAATAKAAPNGAKS